MSIVWMTGFEPGILSINGGGIVDVIAGSPIVQGTTKHSGSYALSCTGNSELQYIGRTTTLSIMTLRVYLYFSALPTGAGTGQTFVRFSGTIVSQFLGYDRDSGKLLLTDGSTVTNGPTVTTGQMYCIDLCVNGTAGTIDWKVDGQAQTQRTIATGYMTQILVGVLAVATSTVIVDDIMLCGTAEEFPIGQGGIAGLRPAADGSHNNATNILEDSAGNDINGTSVFAFDKLEEAPWTSTANADYVRQTGNGSSYYCEVTFDQITQTAIQGAVARLQWASATATGNSAACIIIDEDTTQTGVYGTPGSPQDYSETSAFYSSVVLPNPSGGWDTVAVNALKSRFGYAGDANPDPYWLAMILEVGYKFTAKDNQPAYTNGTATATNVKDNQLAFTSGRDTASSDKSVYLRGQAYAPPLPTIHIDHETGDFSQYTGTVQGGGDLTVSTDAALAGTGYGLRMLLNDTAGIYGWVDFTSYSPVVIRARFYIDVSGLTFANGDNIGLCYFYNVSPATIFQFIVEYTTADGAYFRILAYDDEGVIRYSSIALISGSTPHFIEAKVTRETADGANNGELSFWMDGSLISTRADIGNRSRFGSFASIRFGAGSIIDPGTSGIMYMDELVVNDNGTEIGPIASRPAYLKGSASASSSKIAYLKGQDFAPPTPIIHINHETGDLSQYSLYVDDGGDLSVTTDARLAGTGHGLSVFIDDQTNIYGQKDLASPDYSGIVRVRIYIDPNDITIPSPNEFTFLNLYNSGTLSFAYVNLVYASPDYSIYFRLVGDTANYGSNYHIITNEPHYIELVVARARTSTSADGWMQLWIDGVSKQVIADKDNYDQFESFFRVRFGGVSSIDLGTSGTVFLDELHIVNTNSEIGPIATCSAYLLGGEETSSSKIAYTEGASAGTEIADNSPAFTKGQDTASGEKSAYLSGQDTANDLQYAYLKGQSEEASSKSGFTKGQETTYGSLPAYVQGSLSDNSGLAAYLQGSIHVISQLGAYLLGSSAITDARSAFTQGQTFIDGSIPGFLAGTGGILSSKSAYVSGASSTQASQDAYTTGQSTSSASQSAYLEGVVRTHLPAFIVGGIIATDNLPGYLQGIAGFVDNLPAFTVGQDFLKGNKPAFLKGQDTSKDNQPVFLIGQQSDLSEKPAFLVGWATAVDAIPGYAFGVIFSKSNKGCYLTGSSTLSSSIPAFLSSLTTASSNLSAYLTGVGISVSSRTAFLVGGITSATPAFTKGSDSSQSALSSYLSGTGQLLRPDGDIYVGNWLNEIDGTPLYSSLNEVNPNDSTYVWYQTAVINEYFECSLTNPLHEVPVGIHVLRWRAYRQEGAQTVTLKCEVRQGEVIIASDERVLTDAVQQFETVIDGSTITDYDSLQVRITITGVT